jgi:hypothetical protein
MDRDKWITSVCTGTLIVGAIVLPSASPNTGAAVAASMMRACGRKLLYSQPASLGVRPRNALSISLTADLRMAANNQAMRRSVYWVESGNENISFLLRLDLE